MTPWRRALYVGGIGVGGFLFAYQLWRGYQAVTRNTLAIPHPALIALAWGTVVVAFVLQFMAWAVLMRGLGVLLSWRDVAWGYPLSFLPRYLPGSIWGYVSRSEWLHQSYDIAYSISGAGTVLEILAALSALTMISGIYLARVSTGVLQLVYGVFAVMFLPASWQLLRLVHKIPFLERILHSRNSSGSTSFTLRSRHWIMAVILNFTLWLCYGGLVLLISDGFGLQNTGNLIDHTFLFGFAWLAGFAAIFIPAGLGVREIALSGLLSFTLGISSSQASVISVTSRFIISLGELAWVLVALLLKNASRKRII